jgi:hypothetical protein
VTDQNRFGYKNITNVDHQYGLSGEYIINIYPYTVKEKTANFGIHSEWDKNNPNGISNYITRINNIPKTCNNISGLCAYADGFTTLTANDLYLFTQCNTDGTFYNCTGLSSDLTEVFKNLSCGLVSMNSTFYDCPNLYVNTETTSGAWFDKLSQKFWNNYSNIVIDSTDCFRQSFPTFAESIPSEWGGGNYSWKKIFYSDLNNHMFDNTKHLVEDSYLKDLNEAASPDNADNIVIGGRYRSLSFC